jgi:hypothetical protein
VGGRVAALLAALRRLWTEEDSSELGVRYAGACSWRTSSVALCLAIFDQQPGSVSPRATSLVQVGA